MVTSFDSTSSEQKNFLYDGQAEAGAVYFGGKERTKELRQDIGGNARAIIKDAKTLKVFVGGMNRFAAEYYGRNTSVAGGGFGGVAGKI